MDTGRSRDSWPLSWVYQNKAIYHLEPRHGWGLQQDDGAGSLTKDGCKVRLRILRVACLALGVCKVCGQNTY